MSKTVAKEKGKRSSKDRSDRPNKAEKDKPVKAQKQQNGDESGKKAFSLLANDTTVDSTLSALFTARPSPPREVAAPPVSKAKKATVDESDAEGSDAEDVDQDISDAGDSEDDEAAVEPEKTKPAVEEAAQVEQPKRKRKRKDVHDELEDAYMAKLGREEAKETEAAAAERAAKRQKAQSEKDEDVEEGNSGNEEMEDASDVEDDTKDSSEAGTPPPRHETQDETADTELAKANRTVFLGNVSSTAITSKTDRKELDAHLTSFFAKAPQKPTPRLESLRFRSTAYNTGGLPRKAAYAQQSLMPTTTRATNAYAIYSTPALARLACQHLNASTVLGRHLRVDSVAHPSPQDHRRCVFIGNLGFVDDETAIREANKEAGYENRKTAKEPADVEEGLWRTFSKAAGAVESVRVIRDEKTRVGKGIAYVQFENENSVEAALLLDEKKFPPLLPRKLRVTRAKAQKRNVKPGQSGRPGGFAQSKAKETGYKRKITPQEASHLGRAGKLLGKAAAAQQAKTATKPARFATGANSGAVGESKPPGIKGPEAFVFEGHRASVRQGKSGLKLGGKKGGGAAGKNKGGKPAGRSAKRGAAFKKDGGKKKSTRE
ncbi:hypothetical protein MBLNU230_g6230t1 [Neophaeotheca triangularis]